MTRILVVDDEKAVAEMIKTQLESEGFEVSLALDGASAFQMASKAAPDLMVLDILMPGMDGYQLYKKIRADERMKNIPILIMSVRGGMGEAFVSFGVESFLAKPFEPGELLLRIKTILKNNPPPS